MYAFIRGIVAQKNTDSIVLEAQGIGYLITVSPKTLQDMPPSGEQALVYTYLVVREDALQLYGFASLEEKSMFERLIGVSGIGPKLAIAVLSGMSTSELALAIATNDVKAISRVPGVGKRSAERMILELKDKIDSAEFLPAENTAVVSAPSGQIAAEAADALMALGYSGMEAARAVAAAGEGGEVQDVILRALKLLDRR